ncbi:MULTISPECIES: 2-amino-4-hydroxy-6-hydroxymethyldihydropteridine diphosphokinase [Arthrobacter]|uniref:2-amino-4-hydroxy-6-hydroxymethyldihydropteridine diphosphokinase n=2 Tax=Arthrobacter TaxID=1663 RepID=A0ABU9KMK9_9MICC|nr:2-amino-4-hydroxy-6-hydroxymethyldihydropteridine diphosphokinase [Arthrobacter sp. YJM1]MDP5226994.1 2-amino-4-hydroxy-6-hydroxymethyldihydropteridine diphosphokinase [Arthrobacter sp. YJM1]
MSTTRVILALGSNLGERQGILSAAVADLVNHPKVHLVDISPIIQTKSVGGPEDSPDYLNMVMAVDTELTPLELLAHCQAVERMHHRVREVRWGPRTLDVDVIVFGELRSDDPALTLPHPRAAERAFVLVPWAAMDPTAELNGTPVKELAIAAADYPDAEELDEY